MSPKRIQQPVWFGDSGAGQPQSNEMSSYTMNLGNSYGMANPYTGMPLDRVAADRLYLDMTLRGMDGQIALAKSQQEFEFKKELELLKQQGEREVFEMRKNLEDTKLKNAMKRDEAIYRRKLNRELAKTALFENTDGFLCQELTFPDGQKMYADPIINRPHLQMVYLCALDDVDNVVGIIGINNFAEKIVLFGKSFNASGLGKTLEAKGVTITVGRDRKKQILEILFTYLVDKAKKKQIPSSLGWHQTEQGWMFAAKASQTMLGARKGDYECE